MKSKTGNKKKEYKFNETKKNVCHGQKKEDINRR